VKVAGLDLSLTASGYALITDPDKAVPMWWTSTHGSTPPAQRVWVTVHERIHALAHQLLHAVDFADPDLVVMEGPSLGSTGAGTFDRSGLWWLVYDGLLGQGRAVAVVPPSNVKTYGTGKGGGADASKDAVLLAAARRYTSAPIRNNNEADALLLAAMGCRWLGAPVEKSLPQTHTKALTKCQWPTTTTKEGTPA
jgi:crossover junction endodeoxyribonuclease RuvC